MRHQNTTSPSTHSVLPLGASKTAARQKISLWKIALATSMLSFGAQNTFAACAGTLHFKKPDDWPKNFYIAMINTDALVTESYYNAATGYYEYNLADAGGENFETSFAIESAKNVPMNYILSNVWNGISPYDSHYPKNNRDIRCPGAGNDVWVLENPKKANTTLVMNTKPNIKYFYVLLPDDEAWKSTTPMWSGDGTYKSRQPLKVDPDMCGWHYAVWMDEAIPEQIIIFKGDDELLKDPIGVDGWGKSLTPFPIKSYFDAYTSNKVYFIADPQKVKESSLHSSISELDPQVDGNCSYELAAILYDTDASLHGAFTCDAYPTTGSNGCYSATAKYNYPGKGGANTVPCIGVTKGIVSSTLDPITKKPTYNTSSGCFVSKEAFDVMFTETPGINAAHCRNVKFDLTQNGMWEYDSYNESSGAFTPLNNLSADPTCTGTCAIAATLRDGQGNVRYGVGDQGRTPSQNGISRLAQQTLGTVTDWSAIDPETGFPYIDLYPVSDGEFASGTEPNVYDNTTWDLRVQGKNNQMFCFESHANFTYRKGTTFLFRGDDDLWVYIDNKLAVDLGGNHLAAPSFVNLDNFAGASGALIPGSIYNIDIFYCDRRSDMSNLRIKTNAYITQKATESTTASLTSHTEILSENTVAFPLCYTKAMSACESAANVPPTNWCEGNIPKTISYSLETEDGTLIYDGFESGTAWSIYYGGIDLTEQGNPKINMSAMKDLVPGLYNLVAKTSDATHKIPFEIVAEEKPEEESPCEGVSACCPAVNINITINMNVIVIGGTPYVFGTDSLMQIIQTAFGDYTGLINVRTNEILDTISITNTYGTIKDSRDGKTYKTIVIGSQNWMAENLNYDPPYETTWCASGDCSTYGRLYSWHTATNTNICPTGWRVPTNEEWEILYRYVDENNGDEDIETSLKSISGWATPGSNIFGFSALPAGYYWGSYDDQGTDAAWWSSSEDNFNQGYDWRLYNGNNYDKLGMPKEVGFAIRCISDDTQEINIVEKQTVLDTVRYIETQTHIDTVRYIQTLTTMDTVRYIETKTYIDTVRYFETVIDTLHYIETQTIVDTLHFVETQTITDTLHFIETKTIVDTLHFVENKVIIDTIRYTDNTPNQKFRSSSQDVASEKTDSDYVMTIGLEKGMSLSYLRRDGNKLISDGKISLFDLRGNLITRKNNSIDLNGMNSGIYIAKSGKKTLRIAIQPSR